MKQLIERFQRTSCTPRNNVMLNTPRYAWGTTLLSPTNAINTAGGIMDVDDLHSIFGSPKGILGSADPDCFNVLDCFEFEMFVVYFFV